MNNRSRIEQETTITFNAAEPDALIWSAYSKTITKLRKMGFDPYRKDSGWSYFRIPKQLVSFRSNEKPLENGLRHLAPRKEIYE